MAFEERMQKMLTSALGVGTARHSYLMRLA